MSTDIVQHTSLRDELDFAKALSTASLLPAEYVNKPGNVLLAVETGKSLGLAPMAAIQGIHVIKGKPSASANLIQALVRRAGHTFRIKADDKTATATIIRKDDPEFTYDSTWDLDKAKRAGLLGNDNWKKYPQAMLAARATTEVARLACADVLSGVQYTPEELGAVVDEDGNPVDVAPSRPPVHLEQVNPEPTEPTPAEDWVAKAEAMLSSEGVRTLWARAKHDGATDDELEKIAAYGKHLAEAEAKADEAGDPE